MKTPKRFPLLAAALLLGATAVTLAGCAHKEAAPPPPPPSTACKPGGIAREGVPVTVYVNYDAGDTEHKPSAKTENKQIYMCEQDWVVWQSNEGEFEEPKFTEGSPFDKPFKHGHKSLKSDRPKAGTAKHGYNYTIGLVVGKNPALDVDPRIEVME